jgi:hypothetical protein
MKAFLTAMVLCFFLQIKAQQEVFVYDYRNVPDQELKTFMDNEAMYWSKIHANLLKKGTITGWTMCQRVNGLASEPDIYFYFGFGSVENIEKMNKDRPQAEKEVRSSMDKEQLALIDQRLKQKKFRVGDALLRRTSSVNKGNGGDWNYLVHNYAKANNVAEFLAGQEKYFKPFFEENITAKNTKQVFWYAATVLSPRGNWYSWNCYTVDAFKNYSDIFNAWENPATWPEEGMAQVNKFLPEGDFYKSVEWQRTMWLDAEGLLKTTWD